MQCILIVLNLIYFTRVIYKLLRLCFLFLMLSTGNEFYKYKLFTDQFVFYCTFSVFFFFRTWKFKDICYAASLPMFDSEVMSNVSMQIIV